MAYNASDFIIVPQFEGVSIAKEQSHDYLDWYEVHEEVINASTKRVRFSMPTVPIFMQHYLNVIAAEKSGKTLYDGNGNPLAKRDSNEIYRMLTSNCGTWLDAMFSETIEDHMLVNSKHAYFEDRF